MKYVRQILEFKGKDAWSISKDSTVYEALQLMAQKDVGALLVLKEGRVAGIFSERDYARKAYNSDKSPHQIRVEEMMVSKVVYAQPDLTVDECMALLTHKHIRHLPIMENGELVGVISIGDVVKAVISDKDFMIQQLEQYITAGR